MRAMIISDIHANLEALEAVLRAAPAHDAVWNLGDTVGYAANPNEVIETVRALPGLSIRGNHDRACSSQEAMEDFSPVADRAVQWTRQALGRENREWLEHLPPGPVSPGNPEVSCVHGSPIDEDEYLVNDDDALYAMHASPGRITLFGHTHKQVGFANDGEQMFTLDPVYSSDVGSDAYELPLRRGIRYLLNPGSVGQPRDGDWRAGFAMYDQERSLFTWHRVQYDLFRTQESIRRAGLPDFLADRLRQGR
jgi:diadenosine tetraphosphatase ApaH/serine/threonine PP2A family protein phosphatase